MKRNYATIVAVYKSDIGNVRIGVDGQIVSCSAGIVSITSAVILASSDKAQQWIVRHVKGKETRKRMLESTRPPGTKTTSTIDGITARTNQR